MSINPPSAAGFSGYSQSLEGLRRASQMVEKAAGGIAGGDVTSARMVSLIEGQRMFEANATVIRAKDEMVGTLLNVRR